MAIEIGSSVTGTVVKIADYGAIVRLVGGDVGLVHISEVADAYVRDVRDYLSENDEVTVKVLRLNDRGRYELSIKRANGEASAPEPSRESGTGNGHREHALGNGSSGGRRPPRGSGSFEDQLLTFLRDGQEVQHDAKRHTESKHGHRKGS